MLLDPGLLVAVVFSSLKSVSNILRIYETAVGGLTLPGKRRHSSSENRLGDGPVADPESVQACLEFCAVACSKNVGQERHFRRHRCPEPKMPASSRKSAQRGVELREQRRGRHGSRTDLPVHQSARSSAATRRAGALDLDRPNVTVKVQEDFIATRYRDAGQTRRLHPRVRCSDPSGRRHDRHHGATFLTGGHPETLSRSRRRLPGLAPFLNPTRPRSPTRSGSLALRCTTARY